MIIDQDVLAARLMFDVFDLTHQFLIESKEWCLGIEVAFDQRFANENFACLL